MQTVNPESYQGIVVFSEHGLIILIGWLRLAR
jgi:hypothetical protein